MYVRLRYNDGHSACALPRTQRWTTRNDREQLLASVADMRGGIWTEGSRLPR
jgi:hypothetical protein